MVAASLSSLPSTSSPIRACTSGSPKVNSPSSERNLAFPKATRIRRLGAHRHHPYSGAVPHSAPPADIGKAERRMRLATLRKLHVALDIRDELEEREEREVAALAELGVGVAALRESLDALERRIRAVHPEWPGFAAQATSMSCELKTKNEPAEDGQCELAPETGSESQTRDSYAESSTGTTPTLGSPIQHPSTPRVLMGAPISAVAVSPGRSCLSLRPTTPGLTTVSSPLAVGRSL